MNIFTLIKPIKGVEVISLTIETLHYLANNKELGSVVLKVPKCIHKSAGKLLGFYESYKINDLDSSETDPELKKVLESQMISLRHLPKSDMLNALNEISSNKLSNVDSINLLLMSIGIKANCISDYRKAIKSGIPLNEYHIYPTRTSIKYHPEDYVICGRDEFYALKQENLSIESKGKLYRHKDLYKFK